MQSGLWRAATLAFACAAVLEGCGSSHKPPPMGPPEVGVVTIEPQPVLLTTVLPGRTSPYAVSDVRPQVGGIIQARLFQEGGNVRAGQVLYQIDPATYKAAYDQAKAQLASAQANVATAKVKAERYGDLVKINGVAKQDYDDAKAAYLQAVAAVQQNQAAVQSAKINLDYTQVKAPISGRIGKSTYTKGALVTASQADALTTIQTLDPIYVDINQSAAELLKLRRSLADGALTGAGPNSTEVTLKLEDGSDYPLKGRLEFADVTVDQTTGAVTLRAIFPNPKGLLLPGLYVRAVVAEGGKPSAILAPQQGVTRDQSGAPIATVVNAEGKTEVRKLTTQGVVGDKWLVTSGLNPGDRLIVEGLQRLQQPGMAVHVVPAGSPPPSGPPFGPPAKR
jgi:membrane fusion protein (multidrug efflux system)